MADSDLDLSSFPLLRIDQIHRHSSEILIESEKQLVELQQSEEEIQSIAYYITKLLNHIRKELNERECLKGDDISHSMKPPHNHVKSTSTPQRRRNDGERQVAPAQKAAGTRSKNLTNKSSSYKKNKEPKQTLSFFICSSTELRRTSFQSRAKHVKASLQARQNANDHKNESLRKDQTRKILKKWRMGREQSKQRREELLKEERRAICVRRRARKQREERIQNSMQIAAEEAKSLALQSDFSPKDAILEAAAAAARVVEDQSAVFNECDTGDSDAASSIDDIDISVNNCMSNVRTSPGLIEDELIVQNGDVASEQLEGECNLVEATQHCENVIAPKIYPSKVNRSIYNFETCDDAVIEQTERNVEVVTELQGASLDESALNHQHFMANGENERQDTEDVIRHRLEEEAITTSRVSLPEKLERQVQSHSQEVDRDSHPFVIAPKHFVTNNEDTEQDSIKHRRPRPHKLTRTFPSFFHVFPQFASDRNLKNAGNDLVKCMQIQLERCACLKRANELCEDEEPTLFYHIKSNRPEVIDIVDKCFSDRRLSQWEETVDGALWNLLWTWGMPKAADFKHLLVFQKISRFRHTRGLTRKDLLKKNIQRFMGMSDTSTKDDFNIMPLTYTLPHEFNAFVKRFASDENAFGNTKTNFWIIKPIGLSRGRGISLIDSISEVSYSQPIVIQKYIDEPLLFMGYKFDLRVYVLVTSFSPLEAFAYKEGFARFGTRQYSTSRQSINDLRIHFTNSSIQKEFGSDIDRLHPVHLAGSNGAESKVAMTWLWKRLEEIGMDSKMLWRRVTEVCIKGLIAGGSDICHQPNSFELFGFDVIFDRSLKCWLIEVNSSPSMSCDTPLDSRIKGDLIRDSIVLVDPPVINQEALFDVCHRRLSTRKEASAKSSCDILEQDLRKILNDEILRDYGEMPRLLGSYERIAPGTDVYDKCCIRTTC